MRRVLVLGALLAGPAPFALAGELPVLSLRARVVQPEGHLEVTRAQPWQGRVHLMALLDTPAVLGLRRLSALGGGGYLVSVDAEDLVGWGRSGELPLGVVWLGSLEPMDRLDPRLPTGSTQSDLAVRVRPFRDVDFPSFEAELQRFGAVRCDPGLRLCDLRVDADGLAALSELDPVSWVQPAPEEPVPVLDGVVAALGVDQVRPGDGGDPPRYDLSGEGVTVGIWDPDRPEEDHPDFADRIVRAPTMGGGYSHATQCAGALGGTGLASEDVYEGWGPYRWVGVAPGVEFAFFLSAHPFQTFSSQLEEAVNDIGVELASFSYRAGVGGFYDGSAAALDDVVAGDVEDLDRAIPLFWATANEGDGDGYFSLADYAAAKNVIAVGASNANDDTLADFSSMGPTADGRIKPDVLAPGCYDSLAPEVFIDSIRAGDAYLWTFEVDGDTEGWEAVNDLETVTVEGGLLHTQVTGRDPHMHGPVLDVSTDDVDEVEIVFHASGSTTGQLFWKTQDGDWSEDRHVDFFMPGRSELTSITLDLSDHEAWTGQLLQIRLDPAVLGVTVPEKGKTYVANCGTSLAAPAVAGVAALMLEAWRRGHPDDPETPPPALYRAALVATALDLVGEGSGVNPDLGTPTPCYEGPDYGCGHGLVQAPGAVAVFGDDTPEEPRYLVDEVTTESADFEVELEVGEGVGLLRVVLAWDDPSGEPLATIVLQDDLDGTLVDPTGGTHEPWILDPDAPDQAATRGPNDVDNLESIEVADPDPGTWMVRVAVGRLVSEERAFALVATADGEPLTFPGSVSEEPDEEDDTGAGPGDVPTGCSCGSGPGRPARGILGPMLLLLVPLLIGAGRRRGPVPRSGSARFLCAGRTRGGGGLGQ